MEVLVHKPSHKFLAYSALSDVGHGEYIEASIKVPEKLPNFRLALYSHNDNDVAHSHHLWIAGLIIIIHSEKCVIFDMNKELFGFNFYHVLCIRKKP